MKWYSLPLKIATTAFLLLLCQQSLLADDYMLKLGERYYKAGDYENAANSFESSLKNNPNNAYTHYMRANALVNLKQTTEAGAEYTQAAALDPGGSIGTYSKQALATLSRQYAAAAQRSNADAKKQPANQGSDRTTSTAPAEMSDDEKRLNAECDVKVAAINRETDDKIRALREEQSERIAANGQTAYRPVVMGYGPYGPIMQQVPYYDPSAANEAINREYAAREDVLKGQALKRIMDIKSYYEKKIEALKSH
jgi:tetratricopeptide (TPR) repeat protein